MGEAWRHIEVIRFVLNIGDLDRLSGRQRASERSGGGRPDHWVAPPLFNKRLGCAMQRNSPKPISFGPKQHAEFRLADTNGVLQHGLKHGSYLARRTRNHLENLRGRGLLLQRLGKLARPRLHLVEQSHVLDRDHRLVGEGSNQFNLLIGEGTHGFALHDEDSDWGTFAQKWDTEQGTEAAEPLALKVRVFRIS